MDVLERRRRDCTGAGLALRNPVRAERILNIPAEYDEAAGEGHEAEKKACPKACPHMEITDCLTTPSFWQLVQRATRVH